MLLIKIISRLNWILKQYKADSFFSPSLARARFLSSVGWRFSKRMASGQNLKKDEIILNFVSELYKPVLSLHKQDCYSGIYEINSPIWVCWWTGIENAPDLVKQCVKSIQKNSSEHPVHIISEKKYQQYLEIPEYIMEKVNSEKICLAVFSDYLRISLLEKYGEIWLDATLFVPRPLPEEMFTSALFTCKASASSGSPDFIANGRWTTYCIGGWKENTFFTVVKKCLEKYWQTCDAAIDYFLTDYTFAAVYENIPYCRKVIDSVPITNLERNQLSGAMVSGVSAESFDEYITETTALYKLSWRERYPLQTEDGRSTVFAYFLSMNI